MARKYLGNIWNLQQVRLSVRRATLRRFEWRRARWAASSRDGHRAVGAGTGRRHQAARRAGHAPGLSAAPVGGGVARDGRVERRGWLVARRGRAAKNWLKADGCR
jgi:hypothetical protein